jgi:hypothetical protein
MVETYPILWSNSFIYGVNIPIFMIKLFEIGLSIQNFIIKLFYLFFEMYPNLWLNFLNYALDTMHFNEGHARCLGFGKIFLTKMEDCSIFLFVIFLGITLVTASK